jgi:hypothetical protein
MAVDEPSDSDESDEEQVCFIILHVLASTQ